MSFAWIAGFVGCYLICLWVCWLLCLWIFGFASCWIVGCVVISVSCLISLWLVALCFRRFVLFL